MTTAEEKKAVAVAEVFLLEMKSGEKAVDASKSQDDEPCSRRNTSAIGPGYG